MYRLSPADELAEIRAEISRLKRRETELRNLLLAAPQTALTGRWSRAVVNERRARQFNPNLLPDKIRLDPRYWQDRVTTYVVVQPLQPAPRPRPGWPIRRDTAAVLH